MTTEAKAEIKILSIEKPKEKYIDDLWEANGTIDGREFKAHWGFHTQRGAKGGWRLTLALPRWTRSESVRIGKALNELKNPNIKTESK